MTNREISEIVFNALKEKKFTPYNIVYGDSYFIFTGKPDSVVHFRLKGVNRHWKFGIWINAENLEEDDNSTETSPVVRFFCQWDTNIDKFKPSASSLLVEYTKYGFKENCTDCWEITHMVEFIKKHKLIAYCGFCGDYAGYYTGSFLKEYISTEWYHHKKKIKKAFAIAWAVPYTKLKLFFAKRSKIVKEIKFLNFEKENPGWSTSYLYSVNVQFTKDAEDDDIVSWVHRWFHKRQYGKFDYYDYAVEVDLFTIEGKDGCFGISRKNEQ